MGYDLGQKIREMGLFFRGSDTSDVTLAGECGGRETTTLLEVFVRGADESA